MPFIHDTSHRDALQHVADHKVGFHTGMGAHISGYAWQPTGDMADVEQCALMDLYWAHLILHKPSHGGNPCTVELSLTGAAELAAWPKPPQLPECAA